MTGAAWAQHGKTPTAPHAHIQILSAVQEPLAGVSTASAQWLNISTASRRQTLYSISRTLCSQAKRKAARLRRQRRTIRSGRSRRESARDNKKNKKKDVLRRTFQQPVNDRVQIDLRGRVSHSLGRWESRPGGWRGGSAWLGETETAGRERRSVGGRRERSDEPIF